MRLSQLTGREVINLADAAKLGLLKETEVLIDIQAGRIEALLVPFAPQGGFFHSHRRQLAIPWKAIRRIGRELIIVEVKPPLPEEKNRTLAAQSETAR